MILASRAFRPLSAAIAGTMKFARRLSPPATRNISSSRTGSNRSIAAAYCPSQPLARPAIRSAGEKLPSLIPPTQPPCSYCQAALKTFKSTSSFAPSTSAVESWLNLLQKNGAPPPSFALPSNNSANTLSARPDGMCVIAAISMPSAPGRRSMPGGRLCALRRTCEPVPRFTNSLAA